jgi:hypothetical protein
MKTHFLKAIRWINCVFQFVRRQIEPGISQLDQFGFSVHFSESQINSLGLAGRPSGFHDSGEQSVIYVHCHLHASKYMAYMPYKGNAFVEKRVLTGGYSSINLSAFVDITNLMLSG